MFGLFWSLWDCSSCKKAKKVSLDEHVVAGEDSAIRLQHCKTLSLFAGSMSSASCTMVGDVIISGSKGKFTIKAPGNAELVFPGQSCSVTKQRDQHGNDYIDITIIDDSAVNPRKQVVKYNSENKKLQLVKGAQNELVSPRML